MKIGTKHKNIDLGKFNEEELKVILFLEQDMNFEYGIKYGRRAVGIPEDGFNLNKSPEDYPECWKNYDRFYKKLNEQTGILLDNYSLPDNWRGTIKSILLFGYASKPADSLIIELDGINKLINIKISEKMSITALKKEINVKSVELNKKLSKLKSVPKIKKKLKALNDDVKNKDYCSRNKHEFDDGEDYPKKYTQKARAKNNLSKTKLNWDKFLKDSLINIAMSREDK